MNTMHHSMTGDHARWAVLWIGKNGWVCKEYEDDLAGATELYVKVSAAGKKGATLLCRNVGFPPPLAWRPKIIGYKKRKHSNGKVERVPVWSHPMSTANQRGFLWCPYCREFRRFVKRDGYMVEDIWYPVPNQQCPVCGITTENHHVRKHNPALNPLKEVLSNGAGSVRRTARRSGSSKLTDEQRAAKRERARRRREARR